MTRSKDPEISSKAHVCTLSSLASIARSSARDNVRFVRTKRPMLRDRIGWKIPRAAPPAPIRSISAPSIDESRLRSRSFINPMPSVLSPRICPCRENDSVLTAPASAARSLTSSAKRRAASLKGIVTLRPRSPPACR